jgi:hypothetical protein
VDAGVSSAREREALLVSAVSGRGLFRAAVALVVCGQYSATGATLMFVQQERPVRTSCAGEIVA